MIVQVECQICGSKAIEQVNGKDAFTIDCPTCGNYEMTGTASAIYLGRSDKLKGSKLSYWTRRHFNGDNRVLIDGDRVVEITSNFELPKPKEQADNYILLMGKTSKSPDEDLNENYKNIASIIGAVDEYNVRYIAEHLNNVGNI